MLNTMGPSELRSKVREFLKEHKSASLGTCMMNVPRSSPVQYFLGDNLDLYILSAGGDKFAAIKENPNVCLLVNTEYITFRKIKGVQVFGSARTSLDDPELYNEAKVFCPDNHLMEREKDLKVIKITPTEVVYLDALEDGERIKQVLKNDEVRMRQDEMVLTY